MATEAQAGHCPLNSVDLGGRSPPVGGGRPCSPGCDARSSNAGGILRPPRPPSPTMAGAAAEHRAFLTEAAQPGLLVCGYHAAVIGGWAGGPAPKGRGFPSTVPLDRAGCGGMRREERPPVYRPRWPRTRGSPTKTRAVVGANASTRLASGAIERLRQSLGAACRTAAEGGAGGLPRRNQELPARPRRGKNPVPPLLQRCLSLHRR